jgi:hypothetical protein
MVDYMVIKATTLKAIIHGYAFEKRQRCMAILVQYRKLSKEKTCSLWV